MTDIDAEMINNLKKIKNNKPLDLLFDITYINLNESVERRERMEKLINLLNLKDIIKRYDAVNGRNIIDSDYEDIFFKNIKNTPSREFHQYLSDGAKGCILSHKNIWKNKVIEKNRPYLILEDDIFLKDYFADSLNECSHFISENDVDMLYLGSHWPNENLWKKVNNNIYKIKKHFQYGLFSYIITPEGAKKLLEMFPIDTQLDNAIDLYNKKVNLNIYHYFPVSVYSLLSQDKKALNSTLFKTTIQPITGGSRKYKVFYNYNFII
tara:strand:+ start:3791 stop:4588 length:798 start_codon:yes stop_codon:yes gene_type:complete